MAAHVDADVVHIRFLVHKEQRTVKYVNFGSVTAVRHIEYLMSNVLHILHSAFFDGVELVL